MDGVFTIEHGATVTISGVTITGGNRTSGVGGGVYNEGTVTLSNCAISGNSAAGGGGIYSFGTLMVDSSTISGNSTQGSGGGIWIAYTGIGSLTNSTISGNSSSGGGGMIVSGISSAPQTTTVNNCTFTLNSSPAGTTGGGAIQIDGAVVSLKNTLVANSVGGNFIFTQHGMLNSLGYNLSDDNSATLSGTGDLPAFTPANVGPLGNYGSPTDTVALLPPSPAIDAVPLSSCTVIADQRGVARPKGAACDIGAYEADCGNPNQAVQNIIAAVNAIAAQNNWANGTATSGIATSLNSTLNTFSSTSNSACGKLSAFVTKVINRKTQGYLTADQADLLLGLANAVGACVGCPMP